MLYIPKEDLLVIIAAIDRETISMSNCMHLFDKYGDMYTVDKNNRPYKMILENEERKELFKKDE